MQHTLPQFPSKQRERGEQRGQQQCEQARSLTTKTRSPKDGSAMKIQCQSCQAKYTIADEKVLGKVVKIRCKKCSATIVINGNEQPQAHGDDGGDTHVFDYANQSNDQW